MKKILVVFGICSVIFACNSGEKSESTSDTSSQSAVVEQAVPDTSAAADAGLSVSSATGEKLISGSDCLTCHKVDTKLVGPAYIDVANKYSPTEANIQMLVDKIIKGGSGVWGEIPMAPHPTISNADATEMVKYILSLKSK